MALASFRYFANKSALSIESIPESIVYVNGEQKGKTPIEMELRGEDATIRLIPESFSDKISAYETRVKLTPSVRTIIRHVFANIENFSQTEIISFDKTNLEGSSVAVVTIPEGVKVSVDNVEHGVTPIRIDNLLVGRHKIEVSAEGFRSRTFDVQTVEGFLLTAFVDLAEDDLAPPDKKILSEKIEKDSKEVEEKRVTILDTPTGYLRVRSKPGVGGEEIGVVKPGQSFKVLSFNAEQGWYEIGFTATSSGWISARYSTTEASNSANQ